MTALLEVAGLRVIFGALAAVDDVSFSVPNGGIMGLIGPNGAGKTTTIDALCGFLPNAVGSIRLDGVALDGLRAHQRAQAGLGRTFQAVELFDDLSVRENLLVAAIRPRWWSPFVDAVAPRRGTRGVNVDDALGLMDLDDLADARPTELSHGQRQLVGVARALAGRPRLVLLDEPAAGLDPAETALLGRLLASLPAAGVSVLLVDHDMNLMLEVCNEITVLDFGRVIASGPTAAVRADPAVIAAYLGGES